MNHLESYGDPQKRNRVFVKAAKADLIRMTFPKETHGHGGKGEDGSDLQEIVTAGCCELGCEPVKGNGFVEVLKPDGTYSYVLNHSEDGTALDNRQPSADLNKLKRDEPAPTMIRKDNVVHWDKQRLITVRELSRLFSLSDEFQHCGRRKQQIDGIGNSVPLGVSEALAQSFVDDFNESTCTR